MKIRYWIIISIICLIIGYLIGTFSHPIKPGGTDSTNSSQGTSVLFITNFIQMTNSINNQQIVWDGFSVLATYPLIYYQHNNKMSASLAVGTKWKRDFEPVIIKQWEASSGPIIGGGAYWQNNQWQAGILAGYQWKDLGAFTIVNISTNLGIGLYGFWKINIY